MVHRCFPEGQEGHLVETWVLGKETVDGWIVVPTDERPTQPKVEVLNLQPIPMEQLRDNSFEGPGCYYCIPTASHGVQAWDVLSSVVRKGKTALIAKGNLKEATNEKLWRLDWFRGNLVLREIIFPENIKPSPDQWLSWPHPKADKQLSTLVDQFIEGLMTSWDQLDTQDRGKEALATWISGGNQILVGSSEPDEAPKPMDLMEAIKASMAAAKQ